MVSDKEILMQAAEKYAKDIASNFFGVSTIPVQTAITYVVRNWVDKHNTLIDLFVDVDGNINTKILGDAAKSVLRENDGFKIGKVKFTEADVDDLFSTFNDIKSRNS